MIKYKCDITEYRIVDLGYRRVDPVRTIPVLDDIKDINRLHMAINEFQRELDWDEMWSIDDAIKRLENGWYFNILEMDDEIIGWVWFDVTKNELCNLYTHKKIRKQGYGQQLIYSIMNLSKNNNINIIYSKVDEWNTPSHVAFSRCGWKKYETD